VRGFRHENSRPIEFRFEADLTDILNPAAGSWLFKSFGKIRREAKN
jgi:hypothetical protein